MLVEDSRAAQYIREEERREEDSKTPATVMKSSNQSLAQSRAATPLNGVNTPSLELPDQMTIERRLECLFLGKRPQESTQLNSTPLNQLTVAKSQFLKLKEEKTRKEKQKLKAFEEARDREPLPAITSEPPAAVALDSGHQIKNKHPVSKVFKSHVRTPLSLPPNPESKASKDSDSGHQIKNKPPVSKALKSHVSTPLSLPPNPGSKASKGCQRQQEPQSNSQKTMLPSTSQPARSKGKGSGGGGGGGGKGGVGKGGRSKGKDGNMTKPKIQLPESQSRSKKPKKQSETDKSKESKSECDDKMWKEKALQLKEQSGQHPINILQKLQDDVCEQP